MNRPVDAPILATACANLIRQPLTWSVCILEVLGFVRWGLWNAGTDLRDSRARRLSEFHFARLFKAATGATSVPDFAPFPGVFKVERTTDPIQ